MCIAILNTKGVTLKKKLLKNCWENNGDGAGLLYSLDGKMQVFKEMKDFDNFYTEYARVRQLVSGKNIVLHFRISTHGKVNETNCHPFLVHDELGFVHNGMIYNAPTSTDFSDTYMFNECILKWMQVGFEYSEDVLDMLQSYIGMGSKLIFLNAEDDFAIVNEKAGHWNMNCWFSNDSYKRVNNWVDYGGTRKYKSGYKSGFDRGLSGKGWGTYDDWYDQSDFGTDTIKNPKPLKDRNEFHYCQSCDMTLYGINEINRGLCEWCHEEREALYGTTDVEDICEFCENDFGPYNKEYHAHLCAECFNDIENGGDAEEEKIIDPLSGVTTPKEILLLQDCDYEPMYNGALQEIIRASKRAYAYNKDLGILECETEDGLYLYDKQKKLWFKKNNLFRGNELGA